MEIYSLRGTTLTTAIKHIIVMIEQELKRKRVWRSKDIVIAYSRSIDSPRSFHAILLRS